MEASLIVGTDMAFNDIQLVRATEDDAGVLAIVSQRAYEQASEQHGKEAWGPRGYKVAKDHLYYIEKLETYCVLHEEVIIGGIIISENGFDHKELVRIFVDPDFQGKGMASYAFKAVMELSPAKIWTVGNVEWNEKNKKFLESNGFEKMGFINTVPHKTDWYRKVIEPVELPTIAELSTDMKKIVVHGKIIEKAFAREVKSRGSWRTLTVTECTFEDDSGDIVLMMWNEQIRQGSVGDRVRVENGYMKIYRGMRQLNIGKVGKLIKLS
ncbi:GNAT family N-acetyltransferase [Candidatus Bathyarchaeota archaeon]|nr:GNAT family N-acetyltransferase [Candidatus Bathyarchaeota archaeon]MBT4423249.1 GNAT family N-acetyltransferase [Candidatus Bathyarchaeota archaeon]MBT7186636.1 GNAT family N-acetyltransferase [Candidatus Bathyarchaeota archaeon]